MYSGLQDTQVPDYTTAQVDESSLQSIVAAELADAVAFIDLEIGHERRVSVDYYRGKPFGNEIKGRSSVVSHDVQDTVQAILPSLLRVFFGSEHVVEYVPRNPENVEEALQATEYVQYLINEDNPGFQVFSTAFKDALVVKTGVIKYWWEDYDESKEEKYTGLDDATVGLLLQDKQNEVKITNSYDCGMVGHEGMMLHDVTVIVKKKCGKLRIEAVPPEEFLIDRRASDIDKADLVAHRTMLTREELLRMGFEEDELGSAGTDQQLSFNLERLSRAPNSLLNMNTSRNPAAERMAYTEAYLRVDLGDGMGIQLRKFLCLGDQHKIVRHYATEEVPFASMCAIPEPHVFFGQSISDQTMDIQRIKSQVLRGMLDSLAQSINPRTTVVEGKVNMSDILNNEVGGIVRVLAPGMVQELTTPFVGQAAFPVLEYMDNVREGRTGITKASQGLDADVMQSTTKAAVMATVTAAQQHIEMIARIFAETGMKRLFKGILRLITRHQDQPRTVKLRGHWVEVNPAAWDATMHVTVNVGLGAGTSEDRIRVLTGIAEKQEAIIREAGPENPIVTPSQYAATLRKIVELAGFKNTNTFFSAVPADYKAPVAPKPEDPAQQSAMVLAQAQREQIMADIQTSSAKLALDREKMLMEDARERYKIDTEERVKLAEIASKYSQNTAKVQSDIDRHETQLMVDVHEQISSQHHQMAMAAQQQDQQDQQAHQDAAQDAQQSPAQDAAQDAAQGIPNDNRQDAGMNG